MSKDLFSTQATDYARYRPSYPAALFDYITGFVDKKEIAWDCATGNGQAAAQLAHYFKKVQATDLSESQLSKALPIENIIYSVGKAEATPFAGDSFDLVTVAQAYHWFAFNDFEKEARRVSKPGGVIAVWGYNIPFTRYEPVDTLVKYFYTTITGPYWDAERKFIDESYQTVPFNFAELPSKKFSIAVKWNKEAITGYLNTWSSVQHFIKMHGYNPVSGISTKIAAAWPPATPLLDFAFPVFLRLGRIIK